MDRRVPYTAGAGKSSYSSNLMDAPVTENSPKIFVLLSIGIFLAIGSLGIRGSVESSPNGQTVSSASGCARETRGFPSVVVEGPSQSAVSACEPSTLVTYQNMATNWLFFTALVTSVSVLATPPHWMLRGLTLRLAGYSAAASSLLLTIGVGWVTSRALF